MILRFGYGVGMPLYNWDRIQMPDTEETKTMLLCGLSFSESGIFTTKPSKRQKENKGGSMAEQTKPVIKQTEYTIS